MFKRVASRQLPVASWQLPVDSLQCIADIDPSFRAEPSRLMIPFRTQPLWLVYKFYYLQLAFGWLDPGISSLLWFALKFDHNRTKTVIKGIGNFAGRK